MKNKLFSVIIGIVLLGSSVMVVFADPPEMPPGEGSDESSISHVGSTELYSDATLESKEYSSSTGGENALLVGDSTITLNNAIIKKSGDESSESSDFFGTNAAVFVYSSGTLNLKGATVTTSGLHANGVFAYDSGTINISDSKINTSNNNSGGIMVTGGGTLKATNVNVETKGNSSAAIRSDRGGGNIIVNKGTYKTSGVGSPAVYSTAKINVTNATLESTSSEGVVVEGANSISLNKVKLIDTNTSLNGNSETYKNIFLYQSMSGDADEGNASFTAKDSTITTNKGDTIFVTNTTATISLENNTFTNEDGDFLRIQTGKWGTSGSNGGNVTLNMINQNVEGNIIVDNISTLSMDLSEKTVYKGVINSDNTASDLSVTLDKDSVIILDGDSYFTSLENEDTKNSNIYLNNHKLIVNGEEVAANTGKYGEKKTTTKKTTTTKKESFIKKILPVIIMVSAILIVISIIVLVVVIKNKRNNRMF